MIKDGRFRLVTHLDSGTTAVDIYDCPRRRWIQVNNQRRTFMVRELAATKAQSGSLKAEIQDAEVTRTIELNDTGERKDFFGYSARHITWTSKDKGESCAPDFRGIIYGDGWYIDPPVEGCFWRTLRGRFSYPSAGCKGRLKVQGDNLDKSDYPMVEDTSLDEHFTMVIRDEVTGVSRAPLDSALFEVPGGYKKVETYRELVGDEAMDTALAALRSTYAQEGKSSGIAPDIMQQLQFLVGEWFYGTTPEGCTFSFVPELGGRILVRSSSLTHCKDVSPDKSRYEERNIFYVDPADTKAHALMLDSEGHVLHFEVSVPEPNKAVFESGVSPDGNRHRITYSLEQGRLHSKYEITRPSGEYWTYAEALSAKKQTPK